MLARVFKEIFSLTLIAVEFDLLLYFWHEKTVKIGKFTSSIR